MRVVETLERIDKSLRWAHEKEFDKKGDLGSTVNPDDYKVTDARIKAVEGKE